MRQEELIKAFDQQAERYDSQWAKMAPIRDALHLLLDPAFADLPAEARILCVGAGTGAELAHLGRKFPRWTFTVVEPAGAMLDVCRRRADQEGIASRCQFHPGYLHSLSVYDVHDAATCFLVSQFFLDQEARRGFFREIAARLRPGALLASSDLTANTGSDSYEALLRLWLRVMATADVSPEGLDRMRAAYAKDVSILAPETVASLIGSAGFEAPMPFFQAGLLRAWISKRSVDGPGNRG